MIGALNGPGELQVRIPASVFGGDIFGIMSEHLREALTIPPPPNTSVPVIHRRALLPSAPHPFAQHPSNPFAQIANRLTRSTLPSAPFAAVSKKTLPQTENATAHNSDVSFLGPQASRLPGIEGSPWRFLAGETPAVPGKSTTELSASSASKQLPATPALVSSLKRYWESSRELDHTCPPPTRHLLTESVTSKADFTVSEPDQRVATRAWSNSVGRDVSERLRTITSEPRPVLKSTQVTSPPDRQIQNVFNISLNNANQHAPNYDDLGERIAEILHEQALQHGIDVT